ncbi:hypothetical protein [Thauera aromatica]|uniref:hypothetical protein n=1 Tax=Thauera aromatica TaxID=59405 RepID=UPI001FFCCA9C|nr:hypothetical protein [Thauera aromatica]MCK2097631.1 hypothetical protein [Thauera aromatica]
MRRFVLAGVLLMPQLGMAADGVATFAAFYQPSGVVSWLVVGLLAVAAGAAIFFSGGAASPAVAAIGSWVGGTMGLSGAAATKAGLALLGGGSIASGGFGIVGGTAVLTAALTFSTELVLDYSVGTLIAKYEYHDLVERSKDLTTLPLPKNTGGLEKQVEALDRFDDVDEKKPLVASGNIELIQNAIAELETAAESGDFEPLERARLHSLLSLLPFIANDYQRALQHAERAIAISGDLGVSSTLPRYIQATASLYDEQLRWRSARTDDLRAALVGEPNNKLIPLLVAIYVDRLSLRMDDGSVGPAALADIRAVLNDPVLEKHRTTNLIGLTGRYFVRLKLAQQKIGAVATSNSERIQADPRSADVLERGLSDYEELLDGAESALADLQGVNPSRKDAEQIQVFTQLFADYRSDRVRLEGLVNDFRERQVKAGVAAGDEVIWLILGPALLLLLVGLVGVRMRGKGA